MKLTREKLLEIISEEFDDLLGGVGSYSEEYRIPKEFKSEEGYKAEDIINRLLDKMNINLGDFGEKEKEFVIGNLNKIVGSYMEPGSYLDEKNLWAATNVVLMNVMQYMRT